MIAGILRRVREHLARKDRREWRKRIFALARRLKWIASCLDLALDIPGLAGNRGGVLELVVIGLEFVVSDTPTLDRHVGRNEILAVALLVVGANLEFHVGPAP